MLHIFPPFKSGRWHNRMIDRRMPIFSCAFYSRCCAFAHFYCRGWQDLKNGQTNAWHFPAFTERTTAILKEGNESDLLFRHVRIDLCCLPSKNLHYIISFKYVQGKTVVNQFCAKSDFHKFHVLWIHISSFLAFYTWKIRDLQHRKLSKRICWSYQVKVSDLLVIRQWKLKKSC